jgi:hypothetical protein
MLSISIRIYASLFRTTTPLDPSTALHTTQILFKHGRSTAIFAFATRFSFSHSPFFFHVCPPFFPPTKFVFVSFYRLTPRRNPPGEVFSAIIVLSFLCVSVCTYSFCSRLSLLWATSFHGLLSSWRASAFSARVLGNPLCPALEPEEHCGPLLSASTQRFCG